MQAGDILTEKEAEYVDALERLWDLVSDAIECGRLPNRRHLFIEQMIKCEALRDAAAQEREGL